MSYDHIPLDTNDNAFATTEYVPNHVTCQYWGGGLKITTFGILDHNLPICCATFTE